MYNYNPNASHETTAQRPQQPAPYNDSRYVRSPDELKAMFAKMLERATSNSEVGGYISW